MCVCVFINIYYLCGCIGWSIVWKLLLSRLGLFKELLSDNGNKKPMRSILTHGSRRPHGSHKVEITEPEDSERPSKERERSAERDRLLTERESGVGGVLLQRRGEKRPPPSGEIPSMSAGRRDFMERERELLSRDREFPSLKERELTLREIELLSRAREFSPGRMMVVEEEYEPGEEEEEFLL